MTSVRKSVLVSHSAQRIYDLVEKVEDYPHFLPWCNMSEVHNRTDHGMEATVGIGLHGINQRFTTLNTHQAGKEIKLKLKSGPFSKLSGTWTFTRLRDDACKVELNLDYEFASNLLDRLIAPVFDPIAASLIDAFVARADKVYGS
jgi:ribosome-associated toxin RatA of RatAB toxin-antitoxin module